MKIIINLGREILLLGSVRESIMKPSETSSGKKLFYSRLHTEVGSVSFLSRAKIVFVFVS
jgi:hypothetical protein